MRAEPPDHLTPHVWQLLADLFTGPMNRVEVIERLTLNPRWNLRYLASRERRRILSEL